MILEKSFTDHYAYTQKDIDTLVRTAEHAGAGSLITTAKDAVKLRSMRFAIPCYVLEIEMRIENETELRRLILRNSE